MESEGKLRCTDTWYVSSVLGAGSSRSLALTRPYEDAGLVPILTIAALVSRDGGRPPEVRGQVRYRECVVHAAIGVSQIKN